MLGVNGVVNGVVQIQGVSLMIKKKKKKDLTSDFKKKKKKNPALLILLFYDPVLDCSPQTLRSLD